MQVVPRGDRRQILIGEGAGESHEQGIPEDGGARRY
jgi:hypothetical protein